MRNALLIAALGSVGLLGACKRAEQTPVTETTAPAETTAVPAETTPTTIDVSAWAGRWTGPEGMFVNITPAGTSKNITASTDGKDGKVSLEMQSDLDTKGIYEGMATAEGISFKRGEETLVLKQATGDETGLKYLAGKKDCLMVKSGEGYCRD